MHRPKGEKVVGDWIKLHNEELHDLHYSQRYWGDKAGGMRWMRHVTGILDNKNSCRILIRKPEGKTPHQKSRWS